MEIILLTAGKRHGNIPMLQESRGSLSPDHGGVYQVYTDNKQELFAVSGE